MEHPMEEIVASKMSMEASSIKVAERRNVAGECNVNSHLSRIDTDPFRLSQCDQRTCKISRNDRQEFLSRLSSRDRLSLASRTPSSLQLRDCRRSPLRLRNEIGILHNQIPPPTFDLEVRLPSPESPTDETATSSSLPTLPTLRAPDLAVDQKAHHRIRTFPLSHPFPSNSQVPSRVLDEEGSLSDRRRTGSMQFEAVVEKLVSRHSTIPSRETLTQR